MANVLMLHDRLAVLNLLVEGTSLRSVTRLTHVHRTTIARLMLRAGERCRAFMDRRMVGLNLNHVQCDEIWTFVLKKQGKLKPQEQGNDRIGDQYLFVALDEETKLVPAFVLGKRNTANTCALMNDLASRIVVPDLLLPCPRPMVSTDGWAAYPNAVDGAFGGAVNYGTKIKDFTESEQPGRYGPPELAATVRRVIRGAFDKRDICTSHVERHNLSIRTFLRRFTRLALGFSKKLECLEAAVALYVAHYNFCRMHGGLPGTPAMAARLTGHPWTMEELLEAAE